MFLPLAVPEEEGFAGLDPGTLARRIPDFVHQVFNQGQVGPTGVLEVQSPPDEGPVVWVVMDSPPDPEEAFALLPQGADVRAVVTGEILPVAGGLRIEFIVYSAEDGQDHITSKVSGVVQRDDPVPGLLQLARRLARMVELPYHEPPRGILTSNGAAFFTFLRGLDNAMLLSGDLMIEVAEDTDALMRPFAEALRLDPGFGLALRVAQATTAMALAGSRIDRDAARRFLDRCYSAQPFDGEACVAVAEQLRDLGDDQRAIAWLQHAALLDPPPPRGLENLGILFANRGDTVAARDLWLRGLAVDGHPDFFAHLARLHFAEGNELDAWDMVLRGLRRLHERTVRRSEWDDDDRGAGVLLSYLHEHLEQFPAPEDVVASLHELRGLLAGEDRVHLGRCLLGCGERAAARTELVAAGADDALPLEVRDRCVRALLGIDVEGFERLFARTARAAERGARPERCLADLQRWIDLQPTFWPAYYYGAIIKRRLGDSDAAVDLLHEAHRLAPDDPDVLLQMALVFDERGNPKRALELVDRALVRSGPTARLLESKAQFLFRLGQKKEARRVLIQGMAMAGEESLRRKELRKARKPRKPREADES